MWCASALDPAGTGVLLQALVILVLGSGLVALGLRWRAMAGGTGAAAATSALLILVGVVGVVLHHLASIVVGVPSWVLVPAVLVAFAVGAGITALTGRRSLDSTPS